MYNKRLNIISNQRPTYDIIIQCSHTFKYIRHCTTDINRAIINRQLCLLTGLRGNENFVVIFLVLNYYYIHLIIILACNMYVFSGICI